MCYPARESTPRHVVAPPRKGAHLDPGGRDGLKSPSSNSCEEQVQAILAAGRNPGICCCSWRYRAIAAQAGAATAAWAGSWAYRRIGHHFLWVTDFPLVEYDEEEKRYVALHTFTSPRTRTDLLDAARKVRAKATT